MAILVDQPLWTFRGEKWSHLVSDSEYGELHAIAGRLGIRRIGFQGDHYDLPARLLSRALDEGATQVDSRVLVRRLREAGLRKPANYEGWTAIVRRGPVEIDEAKHLVAEALAGSTSEADVELLEVCDTLWETLDGAGESLHQLYVLRRPNQRAVAFDIDPSMKPLLLAEDSLFSEPEIWITDGNPHLAVDVLVDRPDPCN